MLKWYDKKNYYLNNCTCSTGDSTHDAENTTLELNNKSYGRKDHNNCNTFLSTYSNREIQEAPQVF